MNCKICKEDTSCLSINTYKHTLFFCKNCKNIYSKKKLNKDSKLKIFLVNLISKITNQNRIKKLLLNSNISDNEFYNYTSNFPSEGGSHFPIKDNINNKWEEYDKNFIEYLKEKKIDLNSKKILSISDEPGIIVKKLEKFTSIKKITLTGFDKETSRVMSKKLNCRVEKFDLNKDRLSNVINDKYDLIFFRSTLNFNLDFDLLLSEIKKVSNEDVSIIFNFHAPTTASCLMWMFDDYTLLSLINIDYLKPLIKKYNFKIIFSEKISLNPRKHYYNNFVKKLFYYPFYFFYLTQIFVKNLFNKDQVTIDSNEFSYKLILKRDI